MTPASLFRPLLPDSVRVAEADPATADELELHPEERAVVARAVPKRRRQFAAGRLLARRLLGARAVPLLPGPDGAPRWPPGVVGSITHCDLLAAVAVGDAGPIAGVGIDVEVLGPLPDGTARFVLSPLESARLGALAPADRGVAERVVFSAKESIYKAQHARSGAFVDFRDVDVHVDMDRGEFRGVLRTGVPGYGRGSVFVGRHRLDAGLIVTAVVVESTP